MKMLLVLKRSRSIHRAARGAITAIQRQGVKSSFESTLKSSLTVR